MIRESKSAGFQVGARRSFRISPEVAWQILTSPEGVRCWLGESAEPFCFALEAEYRLDDGSKEVDPGIPAWSPHAPHLVARNLGARFDNSGTRNSEW